MSEAVHRYRSSLVPLSTLGGVGGGVNTFEDQWLPWIWQPAYHAGQAYAIGAETGPLALCYRPQLLTEAGLPSSPARLARDWSTWPGLPGVRPGVQAADPAGTGLHGLGDQRLRRDGQPGRACPGRPGGAVRACR